MIPLSEAERGKAGKLLNDALGGEILKLGDAPGVEDIAINPPGTNPTGAAFCYAGSGKHRLDTRFHPERVGHIVNLAARFAGIVAEGKGILSFSSNLPGHIRFQGGIEPRSVGGPYVVLRFLPKFVRTFQDYVDDGVAPIAGREANAGGEEEDAAGVGLPTMACIEAGLAARKTFAVFGETGSGKSSLLMSMANHPLLKDDRIVTLEDTPELQFPNVEDVLRLSSAGADQGGLLKDALRCRPDRVLMGEARDGALWHFIMAQYTGHSGGMVTLHASNPTDFFDRVEQMIAQAGIDPAPQRRVLMKTLQRIVWIRRRSGGGRDIVGVYRPAGYDPEKGYALERIDVPHRR